ncbi:MAG: ester cyclase [Chloroflexota bacterium]
MTHPLVLQLQYAKQRWLAGHEGLSEEDAAKRLGEANSISWMVGHLGYFDQTVWCENVQNKTVTEAVNVCGFGAPASTPSLQEMMTAWHEIQPVVNAFLETLTEDDVSTMLYYNGRPTENYGTMIRRQTWHYWYHLGEMQGIRQALGHKNLAQFVGRMTEDVQFAPNAAKKLVDDMVNGLNRHEVGGMEKYWSLDMHWYGPAGIGLKPSLKAFQEEHQKPFLHAFPDKEAFDEIRIAEGEYVAAKGYQQVTHGGNYLGIPATNKPMQIKYMDFWRAEDGKLVENWVMIDLLDFLEQAGYDVANVLKFIGSKPPEFFNDLE